MNRPIISNYVHYSLYLKDMTDFIQFKNKKLSFRAINKLCGFTSPSFIQMLIKRQRNLSIEGAQKIAKGFKLSSDEEQFFVNLVLLNQGQTLADKQPHIQKLDRLSKKIAQKNGLYNNLGDEQIKALQDYLSLVVLELFKQPQADQSPAYVRDNLIEAVSLQRVKNVIKGLEQTQLLIKKDNRYEPMSPVMATAPELQNQAMATLHSQLADLAKDSIYHQKADKRDLEALVFSLTPQQRKQVKKKIYEFLCELNHDCQLSEDTSDQQVYACTVYLYPLTKNLKKED